MKAQAATLPKTGFLRQSQLVPEVLPISSATLQRMVRAGEFPRPVKLSQGVTAWRVEDIRAWIESRQPIRPLIRNAKSTRVRPETDHNKGQVS